MSNQSDVALADITELCMSAPGTYETYALGEIGSAIKVKPDTRDVVSSGNLVSRPFLIEATKPKPRLHLL